MYVELIMKCDLYVGQSRQKVFYWGFVLNENNAQNAALQQVCTAGIIVCLDTDQPQVSASVPTVAPYCHLPNSSCNCTSVVHFYNTKYLCKNLNAMLV